MEGTWYRSLWGLLNTPLRHFITFLATDQGSGCNSCTRYRDRFKAKMGSNRPWLRKDKTHTKIIIDWVFKVALFHEKRNKTKLSQFWQLRVFERCLSAFPRLTLVTRFLALYTGYMFSRALHRSHVFPRLSSVDTQVFPRLTLAAYFLTSRHRRHVFPRLALVASFVTFRTDCIHLHRVLTGSLCFCAKMFGCADRPYFGTRIHTIRLLKIARIQAVFGITAVNDRA